jgi:hypothetical protein
MPITRTRWLKFWSLYNIALGFLMVLAAWSPFDRLLAMLLDVIYWPLDGVPGVLARETRLAAGIAGATLVGWCTLIYGLAANGAALEQPAVRRLVLTALAAWFVLDSAQSLANGAPLNVVLNLIIGAGFAAPLLTSGGRPARAGA